MLSPPMRLIEVAATKRGRDDAPDCKARDDHCIRRNEEGARVLLALA
ncbi:hypothetical protein L483_16410 [Pseudomonas putida H8234]|uniref:Uncharacterized protein n=1 Tax=Pseudomonas taiwanensis SJ9 TaxID=1388762 RepID=V7D738_9PSED|nr:hypothetical protein L483_16410 [Pseudomonas putida H8234]ESW37086.1 hypothetical protein O164_26800 [Pseudomonas taiwanensis SJ9]